MIPSNEEMLILHIKDGGRKNGGCDDLSDDCSDEDECSDENVSCRDGTAD